MQDYYKVESDSTETESATDKTRQSQTRSMDGSNLCTLMDAFQYRNRSEHGSGLQQECRVPQAAEAQGRQTPRGGYVTVHYSTLYRIHYYVIVYYNILLA